MHVYLTKRITPRNEKSLSQYLSEIDKIRLLTPEEEVELFQKYKNENCQTSFKKLIEANLRFVVSVAKEYENMGLSLNDLVNAGNIGLIKAIKKFDETRGFKLISYAVWWIQQSIILEIQQFGRAIHLPLNKQAEITKMGKEIDAFHHREQRNPDPIELADLLNIEEDLTQKLLQIQKPVVSCDTPLDNDSDSILLIDILTDREADQVTNQKDTTTECEKIFKEFGLSQREIDIVLDYHGFRGKAKTLAEIGEGYGLSKERVRRIKLRALQRLKRKKEIVMRLLSP